MTETELIKQMKKDEISIIGNMSLEERARQLKRALNIVLPARCVSDIGCIRNLLSWVVDQCKKDKLNEHEAFRQIIDFALEASGPFSRSPYAVFMHILKKELRYLQK